MVSFFVEENAYCRGIVPNIQPLASSLRTAGGVVAWVLPRHREPTAREVEFLGSDVAHRYAASGGLGPPETQLWREFEIWDGDIVADKTASCAFFPGRSSLPALLQEPDIDTVLITGTVTNVCCESFARDASTLGYRVVMVADANAACRDEDHNAAMSSRTGPAMTA